MRDYVEGLRAAVLECHDRISADGDFDGCEICERSFPCFTAQNVLKGDEQAVREWNTMFEI
jgi:hypothetical protein